MAQGSQTEGEGGRIAEALPRDANVGYEVLGWLVEGIAGDCPCLLGSVSQGLFP